MAFSDWFINSHIVLLWVAGILLITAGAIGITIYNSPVDGGETIAEGFYQWNVAALIFGIILFILGSFGALKRPCNVKSL